MKGIKIRFLILPASNPAQDSIPLTLASLAKQKSQFGDDEDLVHELADKIAREEGIIWLDTRATVAD